MKKQHLHINLFSKAELVDSVLEDRPPKLGKLYVDITAQRHDGVARDPGTVCLGQC